MFCDLLGQDISVLGFNAPGWGCGSKSGTSVFMSFSDTQCVFKKNSSSHGDFKGKSLPSLNDYWGKHFVLITSIDKLSRARVGQFRPYPTPTLPYPTILPYHIPTLPLPYPYPTPYLTLPYPTPTIPYPSLPHSKLPNTTIPHLYPTHAILYPYPTIP